MGYFPKRSVPSGLLLGTAVSMLTTVAGCALVSFLIHREVLPEVSIGYGVMILLMVSSYMGAVFANRNVKAKRAVLSLGCGACYFTVLMVMTASIRSEEHTF